MIEENIYFPKDSPIGYRMYSVNHYHVHSHSNIVEIVFCLKGSIEIHILSDVILLKENELCCIDSGDVHFLISEESNILLSFYIRISDFFDKNPELEHIWFSLYSEKKISSKRAAALVQIKEYILHAAHQLTSDNPIPEFSPSKLAEKMIQILMNYFNYYFHEKDFIENSQDILQRFNRILFYCHENYQNKITLSEIAEKENINKFYLSQLLRNSNFRGFNKLLSYIRCRVAATLLLTTEESIEEISYQSGFSDIKYFYQYFKEIYKCTPNQYRLKIKEYSEKTSLYKNFDDRQAHKLIEKYIIKEFNYRLIQS